MRQGVVLVDSSVWIDHLRHRDTELVKLLEAGVVACHPFIIGELACGFLPDRKPFLDELARLPAAPVATHEEALGFLDRYALMGRGVGWLDVHLLASAFLAGHTPLLTRDKRLATIATELGISMTQTRHASG